MMDYKGLEALYTIITMQGFEAAAEKLYISQSAVSQRLKILQNYYNDPLIIRTQPYKATDLGQRLMGHFKRISLLESSLNAEIKEKLPRSTLSIAISRDSLETWFMALIEKTSFFSNKKIEIITDDQEITLDYLKKGLVTACFSTEKKAIANCQSRFLGYMHYIMVASPEFNKKYFSDDKQIKENLMNAPAIVFDKNDKLHQSYLKKFYKINKPIVNYHVVPSVQGFKKFSLLGYAYALIPEVDIKKELKEKKLVKIFKQQVWKMPVYLHHWDVDDNQNKLFYNELISTIELSM